MPVDLDKLRDLFALDKDVDGQETIECGRTTIAGVRHLVWTDGVACLALRDRPFVAPDLPRDARVNSWPRVAQGRPVATLFEDAYHVWSRASEGSEGIGGVVVGCAAFSAPRLMQVLAPLWSFDVEMELRPTSSELVGAGLVLCIRPQRPEEEYWRIRIMSRHPGDMSSPSIAMDAVS